MLIWIRQEIFVSIFTPKPNIRRCKIKESQQTDAISRICFNFTVADAHHAVCLLCLARTGFFKNIFRKF